MNTKYQDEFLFSEEALKIMLEAEMECASISVGGLACDLGMYKNSSKGSKVFFSYIIKIARRAKNLTLTKLAEKADIDLKDLLLIEFGEEWSHEPRTVFQLAKALDLPFGSLQVIAGLATPRDSTITDAIIKFAAKMEPSTKLTHDEREAFEEFVSVLAKRSDKDN